MSIDAMKQAREFIESVHAGEWTGDFDRDQLVGSLTSAIEAAERQEPVAAIHDDGHWTHKPGKDPLDQFSGKRSIDVYAAPQQPTGEVVVTTDESGRCVAVTRQDKEGNILSIIWEASLLSQPAIPDGWVLVKRSDLIAVSNKTLYSSCGVCRDVSFALETMIAAAPEVQK